MKNFSHLVVAFIAVLIVSCSSKEKTAVITGETMGTTYTIKIAAQVPDKAKLKAQIDSLLVAVNMSMSTYIPESEISRFNKFKDTTWFEVSRDFAFLVKQALEVSETFNGYYDVTVGPLVNLWGFGPTRKTEIIPSQEEIDSVKKFVGYKLIEVRENPPAIRKKDVRVYIDLSSIAKGYGVDAVAKFLLRKGYENHLTEIGGELRACGRKNENSPWLVGVENPNEKGVATVIALENKSVATSGDYLNYFEYEGKRFSHTINPATGKPITHKLASVSVVCNSCALADAYATAFDVIGDKEGLEIAKRLHLPVYMIIRDGEKFKTEMTKEFRALIKN
jgi:thiamine biosynthesis lipoprotein